MINDQGGVGGRMIIYDSLDDSYSPPKTVDQVRRLKTDFGVYMAESGRANLAGLRTADIGQMAESLKAVLA